MILLKLIVKSIHPNTPNNISTSKYTKPISKISIPLQLLCLQPILARTTFATALPHRVTVSRRTTSLDLRPPSHYLVGPRWFVLVLKFFWVLLYFDWFGMGFAIFWHLDEHGFYFLEILIDMDYPKHWILFFCLLRCY